MPIELAVYWGQTLVAVEHITPTPVAGLVRAEVAGIEVFAEWRGDRVEILVPEAWAATLARADGARLEVAASKKIVLHPALAIELRTQTLTLRVRWRDPRWVPARTPVYARPDWRFAGLLAIAAMAAFLSMGAIEVAIATATRAHSGAVARWSW